MRIQHWINAHFSSVVCSLISEDNYYKDFSELSFDARALINFDDPASLDHQLLFQQLSRLKSGATVDIPQYCFKTHSRKKQVTVQQPLPFIIIEGIHTFQNEQINQFSDLKIFVDTDADLCLARRIARDINERARTLESVITQYFATVKPMYEKHVLPKKSHADIIVDGAKKIDLIITEVVKYHKFTDLLEDISA